MNDIRCLTHLLDTAESLEGKLFFFFRKKTRRLVCLSWHFICFKFPQTVNCQMLGNSMQSAFWKSKFLLSGIAGHSHIPQSCWYFRAFSLVCPHPYRFLCNGPFSRWESASSGKSQKQTRWLSVDATGTAGCLFYGVRGIACVPCSVSGVIC